MSDKKEGFDPIEAVGNIADIVSKSIASGNYASLNREITKALNEAADAVHDSITSTPFFKVNGAQTYRSESKNSYQDAKAAKGYGDRHHSRRHHQAAPAYRNDGVVSPAGSYVRAIIGTAATCFFGIIFTAGIAIGSGPFAGFMGILTAFSGWNMFKGFQKIGRINRAHKILKMMEGRDTITIEEIASAFGKSEKWVADDIQAMVRDGIFTGKTYMDKEETAFMISHEAYNQYRATMAAWEERKKTAGRETAFEQASKSAFNREDLKEYSKMERNAAQREQSSIREAARLDHETAEMVEEGKAFISHIHQKNEEVPDPVFTEKLNRLERIVTNIFDRVAADPESAPDLHRLMKYYLPTTQKLVDTYATLDKQTVQGENIENAKREINSSLDTINGAFEKFLDQFFQTTAWDVSSDISVMNQMMAQDGLTGGNDFARAAAAAKAASGAQVQEAVKAATQAQAQVQEAVRAATEKGSQKDGGSAAQQTAQTHGGVKVKDIGGMQVLVQEEEQ